MKFWHFFIVACLLLLGVSNGKAVVIHVSSSSGNDNNDGLSVMIPLRSIRQAMAKGDTILLKSGDVFYENITLNNGYLSKYGGKEKPVICGYKRINAPIWHKVGDHIWKISLVDTGFIGFDTRGSSLLNNVGCLHEYGTDKLHGRKVQYKSQLKEDWDIWQTEHHSNEDTKASDFDTLYLYLHKDPNTLGLEFSVGTDGVFMRNSTIEDVRIEGFGRHGIAARTHSVICHCEIDAIGGMTQLTDREYVSLGNGIEFWLSEPLFDCVAESNKISRCYDCACTIQGRKYKPTNIFFRNNLIIDCCQGWEDFLTNESKEIVFENCVFEDNIVLNSGKTAGFNYPENRFKYCHVLGNNFKGNKGMIIRNNLFVGGNYYCSGSFKGKYKSNIWQGNKCYIKRGDHMLSNYSGTKDVIRIPVDKGKHKSLKVATKDAIASYRELTGDHTTQFIIKSEKQIAKKIVRLRHRWMTRR